MMIGGIETNTLGLAVIAITISLSICCEVLEFSCGSGECLPEEQLCDGTTDCHDGSDESTESCMQVVCPPFSFRCAYGACIPSTARCNGIKECADNSDEVNVQCRSEENREKQNTRCLKTEFQCDSGQCVSLDDVCDGHDHCSDQSDESVEVCASNACSSIFFRCGYGACITANKKCDSTPDCLDGSDETFNLCGVQPKPRPTKPTTMTLIPVVTPSPTQPPTSSEESCVAPNINNSRIVYESDDKKVVNPGDEVPSLTSIVYKCLSKYHREGNGFNFCLKGQWVSLMHPICTRYCVNEVLTGVTFNAFCARDGVTLPCNNFIKPGTIARISCPTKYRVPDHNPIQSLRCDDDGQWDYTPPRCEPICGEELLPSVPFLVNGETTNITSVPWHVGVYRSFSGSYRHHCGGSLISAKIVISAAHCFWDTANEKTYDKSLYIIGAGKFYRDYYKEEPRRPQFQNISKIAVPPLFKGENAKFKADIAVLVLTNALILSETVAPICIQWQRDGAKSILNGSFGKVAGWGKDESGAFSDELRTIYIPGSSYEVCKNEVGPSLADSITDDKFCVLNKFNANACQGDSGGGFAVKSNNRYYLWGIVSTGVPFGTTCSNYEFVSYINIQYYEGFITDLETRNRPK